METIFDFNPTKKELTYILDVDTATPEWYIGAFSPGTIVVHLCWLFNLLNNTLELKKRLKKLDKSSQMDFYRTVEHS